MAEIIPAIIPQSYDDLAAHVVQVKEYVGLVQVDVLDGIYTKGASWPYNKRDTAEFTRIVEQEEGLPYWELVNYEVDLMVVKPETKIDDWISAGVQTLIVHLESTSEDILKHIFERGEERGVSIALALKPSTGIELLAPWVERASFIQCMGSDHIGQNGVELDQTVLGKIKDIRFHYPSVTIGIDIGVSEETAPRLLEAGVTRFAASSAIYKSEDIKEAIEFFKNLA